MLGLFLSGMIGLASSHKSSPTHEISPRRAHTTRNISRLQGPGDEQLSVKGFKVDSPVIEEGESTVFSLSLSLSLTGCLHMQSLGKLKGPGLIGGGEERAVEEQLMVLSHQHGFSAPRRDSCEGGGARI